MKELQNLRKIDFKDLKSVREKKISMANETLCEYSFNKANQLADVLHPSIQHLVVSDIIEQNNEAKIYVLTRDTVKGTDRIAYFSAGQYISIFLKIDTIYTNHPFLICSSPNDSLKGFYKILVKQADCDVVSNYILQNWEIGTKIYASQPFGTFTYEYLRDAKKVIGIASDTGIAAFYSMAQAIRDGIEDFSLTILQCVKKGGDILLKFELDEISSCCNKINVDYISVEQNDEDDAFVTSDVIKEYTTKEESSIFVCGNKSMCDNVKHELESLKIKRKFIRYAITDFYEDTKSIVGFPKEKLGNKYSLKLKCHGEVKDIECSSSKTLLYALEHGGIGVPSRCRNGACGYCRSILISGEVFIPEDNDGRRLADSRFGWIHPCVTYPLSDISIEVYPYNMKSDL
jgi:NAD(P)H-flavin reductase